MLPSDFHSARDMPGTGLEIAPCRHFVVARAEERCGRAVRRMSCVTGDPIAFLHCHLLSRSSGRWNRSTASWSAPALTLLSTALGGRLGRLPARTTEALLIYPRFPHFAQLIPAAAPARNGAAEALLWKTARMIGCLERQPTSR